MVLFKEQCYPHTLQNITTHLMSQVLQKTISEICSYQKIGKLPQNAISTNAGEKDFRNTYYMGASDDKTVQTVSILF